MSLNEIEAAVEKLPPAEFSEFARWFEEYEEKRWDHQIDQDSQSGKLNKLIEQAQADYATGRCQEL